MRRLLTPILLLVAGCGSGNPPPNPPPDSTSPSTDEFGKQLETLQQGGEVDLDGDGIKEARTELDANGTLQLSFDRDGDGRAEYQSLTRPDGSGYSWSDSNQDGVHEWEETREAGPPFVTVTLEDQDGDGYLELRTTVTESDDSTLVVVEQDEDGRGEFALVSQETLAVDQFDEASCSDAMIDFPRNTSGPALKFGNISIPYSGDAGRCTETEAKRIGKALACAVVRGGDCLNRMKEKFGDEVMRVILTRKVTVACSLTCPNSLAATRRSEGKLNYNRTAMQLQPDNELCGTTLHEMLHVAGEKHAKDKSGTDKIDACGRFCGRNVCDPIDNFEDCQICAGNDFSLCDPCGMAQAVGLPCVYDGATKLITGTNGVGYTFTTTLQLRVTDFVEDFVKNQVMIKKGLRYEPVAGDSFVAGELQWPRGTLSCALDPSSADIVPSTFSGDFIVGIEPRVLAASCLTNVPGSQLVCTDAGGQGAGTMPTSLDWPWLAVWGQPYDCGKPLDGEFTIPDTKSSWTLNPVK